MDKLNMIALVLLFLGEFLLFLLTRKNSKKEDVFYIADYVEDEESEETRISPDDYIAQCIANFSRNMTLYDNTFDDLERILGLESKCFSQNAGNMPYQLFRSMLVLWCNSIFPYCGNYVVKSEWNIDTLLSIIQADEVRNYDDFFKNAIDLLFEDLEAKSGGNSITMCRKIFRENDSYDIKRFNTILYSALIIFKNKNHYLDTKDIGIIIDYHNIDFHNEVSLIKQLHDITITTTSSPPVEIYSRIHEEHDEDRFDEIEAEKESLHTLDEI